MKPTIKELQQKIAELENVLANRLKDQVKLESLEEKNRVFEAVISQSPSAILVTNEQGKIWYVNDAFHQTLGYSPEEMKDEFLLSILKGDESLLNYEELKGAIQKDEIWGGELRIARKDLQVIWIRLIIFPIVNLGKITNYVAIFNDITGMKAIEAERQEHEKLLSIQHQIDSLSNLSTNLKDSLNKAFQNLMKIDWVDGGGIYLFDEGRKNLRLIFSAGLSEEYTQLVSVFTAKELPAKAILRCIAMYAGLGEFLEPIKNILVREGLTFTVAIPMIYKKKVIGSLNLGSRSAEQVSKPDRLFVESVANRLANLIVLVNTREELLSSNRRLNNSLREIKDQQQILIQKSRLESLGELSAGLAHEISQPLSVISLVMENINYRIEQQQASGEYLAGKFGTITQNINKIRELIDHVRIFSRDQGSIVLERVDVNKAILSAFSMIESQLKNQQIKLITDLNNNIGYALGNASRFEQVVLNLISNAKYALEEKEKKFIAGSRSKEIRINTFMEEYLIIVRVWDNGTGISSENLDKIFNPFFTTKADGRGTGLGLPIVYGIVTEMKGEITARSKEGEFTEITITLPCLKKVEK